MKIILLSLVLCLQIFQISFNPADGQAAARRKSPPTVVYLVRHAEKVTTNPDDADPDLTAAGYARAEALQQYMQGIPVAAFFTSPFKRTQYTLTPLAAGRTITTYKPHDYAALRAKIWQEYAGKPW